MLLSLCIGVASCDAALSASSGALPEVRQVPIGAANEMAVREEVINTTWALLEMRDFAGVDRLAKTYRDRRERTPSGTFKAAYVYYTIGDFLRDNGRAPCGEQRQAYVEDWIKAVPQSPPAIIAYAHDFVLQGLCARGLGDRLKPKGQSTFDSKMQIAAVALQDNKTAAAEDPQWYAMMEEIATYQRWDESRFEALHAEAVSKYNWYYQIYFQAGRYYLPRWGGNVEAFDRFARRSVERTRATDGTGLYARLYWIATQEGGLYHDLKHYSRADLDLLRTSMRDVASRYPDLWNYNYFAWISCRNEMFGETKTYLDRITDPPSYPPWPTPAAFTACKYMADRTAPSV